VTRAVTDAPRRHRRIEHRPGRRCARCKWQFVPTRSDALYCSHRCRTIVYRARHLPWALITWAVRGRGAGQLSAQFRYFPSREAALAAAPQTGEPWEVIDTAIPVTPYPSIAELLRTRLIEGEGDPYPPHGKGRWTGI
jgi:hypothetical protein